MMTIQELEQAIRESFKDIYKACYTSRLHVKEIKSCDTVIGYTLVLELNNREKPLTISADGDPEQFLTLVKKELREKQLIRVDYYDGYQVIPDDKCGKTNR